MKYMIVLDGSGPMGFWAHQLPGASGRAGRPSTIYSSERSGPEGGYPVDGAARARTFSLVVPTGFEPVSPP